MLGWLMIVAAVLLRTAVSAGSALIWNEGTFGCTVDGCRSRCQGVAIDFEVGNYGGTGPVSAAICLNPGGLGWNCTWQFHPPGNDNRQANASGTCKVVIMPKPPLDWGDVRSCDDVQVDCQDL